MTKLPIIYISLTGNTTHFIDKLTPYLADKHQIEVVATNVKDLDGETFAVDSPFVSFLPTYLEGGNGVDNGDVEILTNPLGDFLFSHRNFQNCLGIIGSGNRNFNHQFCLTAKQYSKRFGFPVLDEFELRGLDTDVSRIGDKLSRLLTQHQTP